MSIDMINRQLTQNALPTTAALFHIGGMSNTHDRNALRPRALRNLRLAHGVTQEALALQLHLTKQSLSAWETGRAKPTPENIANFLRIIGATETELDDEVDRIAEDGAAPTERALVTAPRNLGEGLLKRSIDDEDLWPWVGQGENVYYEWGQLPRRLDGCVVELKDGSTLVRIFEKRADGHIFLRVLNPEKTESYLWSEVRGLHKIALRGD